MADGNRAYDNKSFEKMLNSISKRKMPPKIVFVLLLLMYAATGVIVRTFTGAGGVFMLFGSPIPLGSLAGIFSSIGNFCLIFLVVFYKKPGFIVSLVILIAQLPPFIWTMFATQNYTALPGVFASLFAIAAIVLIYLNDVRGERFQETLRVQAITDRMTGLPNRFACSDLMSRYVERAERFAVVSLDLNNFKSINDTMGQNTGDEVLKQVASRLQAAAASRPTSSPDFVAHQGGDEFTLVFRDCSTDDDIVEAIRYYESAIEEKMTIDNCDYVVSASFGYAIFPEDAQDDDTLFTYADVAMYQAKRMNGNVRMCRFKPEYLDAEHTLEIERTIRAAFEKGLVTFHLQPLYDTNHQLRGFEALARLKDEDGNMVSPADFIPVAEKTGLVDKIDATVFSDASKFLGKLIQETGTDATLSVNVSVKHMMKNDFLAEVGNILEESGVPANQVTIEVTESIMIDSAEKALQVVNGLKDMGLHVAIDDFGTGYSSLSYLNSFPASLLKIDKSFVDVMNTSNSSKQYVAAIVSIGHIMGLDVIAEGVEENDQLNTLRDIGCDLIQGFLWGRPMPAEDAKKLVYEYARK